MFFIGFTLIHVLPYLPNSGTTISDFIGFLWRASVHFISSYAKYTRVSTSPSWATKSEVIVERSTTFYDHAPCATAHSRAKINSRFFFISLTIKFIVCFQCSHLKGCDNRCYLRHFISWYNQCNIVVNEYIKHLHG